MGKHPPFDGRGGECMKKLAAALAVAALLIAAPTAMAGNGNGVSNSQGANAHGNAVSSGATPQPQ
jgi:predicted small secreted protein